MTQTFEDANKFGKEFLDSSLESFTSVSQRRAGDHHGSLRLFQEGI